ncbi:NifB/NifX family molybdenum-iron cluster-binding protein [uncultured Bacteroides sp.]|uniref:NifB/NifX family molybdenum-iron cluster-binding protein n=1 Tax=uncultured Bacteroides sp. TaxID=162156 RepID=UPI002AA8FA76|nr:NifB/NifX family molybdenum-iron cluster-binding protein [uncultured Bacteroides sp.]
MLNQKIAIPVEAGMLCAHFGHCEAFYMADVENGQIVKETMVVPPVHEPGLYPAWVGSHGIKMVIAGGMGEKAKALFNKEGIEVYLGVPKKTPKELVEDFISDSLKTGVNSCDHK